MRILSILGRRRPRIRGPNRRRFDSRTREGTGMRTSSSRSANRGRAGAIFARYALGGAGPLAVSAARLAIAAVILLSVTACAERASAFRSRAPSKAFLRSPARARRTLRNVDLVAGIHERRRLGSVGGDDSEFWTDLRCVFHGHRLSPRRWPPSPAARSHRHGRRASSRCPRRLGHETLERLSRWREAPLRCYLLLVREVRTELDTLTIVRQTFGWAAVALVLAALLARQPCRRSPTSGRGWASSRWARIPASRHTALNASLDGSRQAPSRSPTCSNLDRRGAGVRSIRGGLPATRIGGLILLASVGMV